MTSNFFSNLSCNAVYPVPNRTAEYNMRIAGHEIGHCLAALAVGSVVEKVTIIPDDRFEGKCVRRGAPSSSLNLLAEPETVAEPTIDIITLCQRMGPPEVGSARIEFAEGLIRAQSNVIELLAGAACEKVLFPDQPLLAAQHDWDEARVLASICASPAAVDALLAFAASEAEELIKTNLHVVHALVEALIERGELDGNEIDAVIAKSVAAQTLTIEKQRRTAWAQTIASAAAFVGELP